jgi:peptidase E
VLIGVGAGAILLTTHITPMSLCADSENDVRSTSEALGLVDIAFVRHLDKATARRPDLEQFAREKETDLYACTDSAGLIVMESFSECVGEHWKILGKRSAAKTIDRER